MSADVRGGNHNCIGFPSSFHSGTSIIRLADEYDSSMKSADFFFFGFAVIYAHVVEESPESQAPASSQLTPRELDVLELLAKGMTNKEIATELVITVRTVKFHVSSIMRKLEAGNRTEAVLTAAERGIIEMPRLR